MLGASAAVLQGLHEMRNPKPPKVIEVTEEELVATLRAQGADPTDVSIAVTMAKMGAHIGAGDKVHLALKSPEPA